MQDEGIYRYGCGRGVRVAEMELTSRLTQDYSKKLFFMLVSFSLRIDIASTVAENRFLKALRLSFFFSFSKPIHSGAEFEGTAQSSAASTWIARHTLSWNRRRGQQQRIPIVIQQLRRDELDGGFERA